MDEIKKDETLKTRTGNGYLKQLFSTARTSAENTHTHLKNLTTFLVNFVPIDKVDASELQVRTHFDDKEIEGLSQSIKEHGVLQPILVVQDGDRYKVIAGERRLRASKLAGMDRIPARVLVKDDKSTHEIALRENLDRVDLHPIEEGEGYLSLLEAKAYTSYESIAKAFGKPKSRITECIGFTRLPSATKEVLLKQGLKQRSLLRQLQNGAAEQHVDLIQRFTESEEALVFSTPSATKSPKAANEAQKPFEFTYEMTDKNLAVPKFGWKKKDGEEKLEMYVSAMKGLIVEIENRLLTQTKEN